MTTTPPPNLSTTSGVATAATATTTTTTTAIPSMPLPTPFPAAVQASLEGTVPDMTCTTNSTSSSSTSTSTTTTTTPNHCAHNPGETPISTTLPTTPTPTATALLREWSTVASEDTTTNSDNNNNNDDNNNMMEPPVLVAPAVVLNETSEGSRAPISISSSTPTTPRSSAGAYSYPMATLVSNFVRTSVNELRDHMANHIYASAIPETDHNSLSSNSHAAIMSTRSEPAFVATVRDDNDVLQPRHQHAASVRSFYNLDGDEDDDDDASAEFVLMPDGDLVALPSSQGSAFSEPPLTRRQRQRQRQQQRYLQRQANRSSQDNNANHANTTAQNDNNNDNTNNTPRSDDEDHFGEEDQDTVDEQAMKFSMQHDRTNCRPNGGRVRRGVKGVSKWLKKGKKLIRGGGKSVNSSSNSTSAASVRNNSTTTTTTSRRNLLQSMLNNKKNLASTTTVSSQEGQQSIATSDDANSVGDSSLIAASSSINQSYSMPTIVNGAASGGVSGGQSVASASSATSSITTMTMTSAAGYHPHQHHHQRSSSMRDLSLPATSSSVDSPGRLALANTKQAKRKKKLWSRDNNNNSSSVTSQQTTPTRSRMDTTRIGTTLDITSVAESPDALSAPTSPRQEQRQQVSPPCNHLSQPPIFPDYNDSTRAAAAASASTVASMPPTSLFASAAAPARLQDDYHHQQQQDQAAYNPYPEAASLNNFAATIASPPPSSRSHRRQYSAEACFVGNADQLWNLEEAGVLPAESIAAETTYIEDRLDDYDKYEDDCDEKKKQLFPRSLVPPNADFKVDKSDSPCDVDSMLRRAGELQGENEGEDSSSDDVAVSSSSATSSYSATGVPPERYSLTGTRGKSDGKSVPLSQATSGDPWVHNDMLKVVLLGANTVDKTSLGRALRKKPSSSTSRKKKRTTLGVDVHSWTPQQQQQQHNNSHHDTSTTPNTEHEDMVDSMVKFTIWDVQGAGDLVDDPYSPNFGAHPGTQSLFFSDRSLYLLVWDLAAKNRKTYRREAGSNDVENDTDDDNDDDEDHDDDDNEYLREEANRQADRALHADIEDRVLTWVDCVARRGSHSAILPVALVPSDMSPTEAKRRCDAMQTLLMEHTERKLVKGEFPPPKVLSGAETILCVSLDTNMGMDLLGETILAIATDANHSVFDHVLTPVPRATTHVLETCRRLKRQDHKLLLVDQLMAELNEKLSVEQVVEALYFLASIGEVLYFGDMDEILSHYVILSRKWMVSALSCILRNDLKRELAETRRFMNMQCLYSDQQFHENQVTQTFSTMSGSNCPLLSSSDTQMLWQSMSFMREAADRTSQLLSENPTTASTMFGFLEHLLVHTGVFLSLEIDRFASPDHVYFVPSLLAQSESHNVWTFKSNESWMTTLSHSWLFRDGAPTGLMEHVTVALLRDLYEFSHVVATAKPQTPPSRARTFPFAQNNLEDFIDSHDGEAIGHIKIHQIMCWKNSLLVKIGCVFPEGNELRESFVEVFIAIVDQSSPHCVDSDAMRSNMQRLLVSGKGQVGHHGRKLWKGGYGIVMDSIKASVAHCTNVDRQVVCPECLAHAHPSSASTWSWDSVRAAAESGNAVVRCMRGHRVDSNLICGTARPTAPRPEVGSHNCEVPKKPVKDLLPSVVVVGLWDGKAKVMRNVGSGFVVDKKNGLVVTAGHILFDMEEGRSFGTPYHGVKHARVVIGVIPTKNENGGDRAVFRYFADIVAEDIHNMDACVLKIRSRMGSDVEDEALVGDQIETPVNKLQEEQLPSLKMTRRYELEETVRILGFNQGGEGILEQGKHVNRSADFAKGYICKQFKMMDDDNSSSSGDDDDSSSSGSGFSPREEIVIMCPTISGHSGGPCVNDEGRVVGILSRADPVDRQRCYLVPSNELKLLVNKAKKTAARGGLKMY